MKDSLRKRLLVALQHHQAGRRDQAERMYRGILDDHPTQPDTLHLLGVLNLQAGRAAAAVSLIQRAVAQRAEFAEAHLNLGAAHHQLGDLPAAIAALERAIAVNQSLAEAHSNLGDVYRLAGRIDEALAACQRALAINPKYANALNHFGLALSAAGRQGEAIAAYENALALQPRHLEALRNLAAELLEQRRCAESIELLHRALAVESGDPRSLALLGSAQELLGDLDAAERTLRQVADGPRASASALVELGVVLQKQDRHGEAVSYFERAVQQRPEYPEALFNWAHSLNELRRTREGLEVCRRALALQPDSPQGLTNLGVLLQGCDQVEEAVAAYRRALELKPDHADAWSNLGAALYETTDYEAGCAACERALTINPESADAHFNQSLFRLASGDFAAGWRGYEHRLRRRTKRSAAGKTARPKWDGSPLGGRRLLLVAEQGMGDTFQFIRYAPLLRERGGVILAAVPRRMLGILSSCPGIAQLVAEDDPWPDHDVYCEMMSVCQHLTPSVDAIPAPIPYLAARPDLIAAWREELAAYPGFRVGIAWQGSNSAWDYRRVPLETFEPLARVPGVRLVSLQADGGAQVRAATFPVIDFTGRIDREHGAFQDTAAILMNLDLVVSSDTSVPHLAGALGRPVWLALRKSSEWRWQRGRQDTPWYPTMRLYRQTTRGDWAGVLRRVADDLSRRVVGSDAQPMRSPGP